MKHFRLSDAPLICGVVFLLSYVAFSGFDTAHASDPGKIDLENGKPVKYVFLFIGDGLSLPQRMMGEEFLKKTENRGLNINAMPYQAVTSTYAANSLITDSAASGTAIACGEKTNNGWLGVAPEGKRKLESIASVAHKNGRKVGIVTTVTLNHATPAAFYAHVDNRGNMYDIGLELIESNFEYFGGGGIESYNDKEAKNYKGHLYEMAAEAGYTVSRNAENFKKIKPGTKKTLSVGASGALPYTIDTQKDELRLADFTRQGIELLDNPNGFFMMVEGGAIDWMCHANDAATSFWEIIDFDNAVAVALDFQKKNPDETLIVVTGDHETGGLTLGFAGTGYSSYIELIAAQKASTDRMGAKIKQYGQDRDEGVKFDEVKPLITSLSGLVFDKPKEEQKQGCLNLTENETRELENAFKESLKDGRLDRGSILARASIRILNNKSGLGWTSGAHTALPVMTTAKGPQAEFFTNMIDNTDIAKRLKPMVGSLHDIKADVKKDSDDPAVKAKDNIPTSQSP